MISKKEVEHIAELARLGVTEKEKEKLQKELSSILDYVEQLKEVDVKGVKPMSHPVVVENVFRDDEAGDIMPKQVNKMMEQAPQKEGRHIKVKGILNES